jgi:hypothetical protein
MRVVDEHPAVAFRVLRPIAAAVSLVLRFAEDDGSRVPSGGVVLVYVGDVHQHTIDHPRNVRPPAGLRAAFAMLARSLVVRTGSCEHYDAAASVHLSVRETAVRAHHPHSLAESERPCQPLQRSQTFSYEIIGITPGYSLAMELRRRARRFPRPWAARQPSPKTRF